MVQVSYCGHVTLIFFCLIWSFISCSFLSPSSIKGLLSNLLGNKYGGFLILYKSYCLISIQNLKLLVFVRWILTLFNCHYFFYHSLKYHIQSSRNISSYVCIVNSLVDKFFISIFTFKFALSKFEAVLSISGDFLTLLNGVTES